MTAGMLEQKNILGEDGVLSSPMEGMWNPEEVEGSFYRTVLKKVQ